MEREDAPRALLASELLASVLLAVDAQLHADLNGLTSRKKGRHKRALDPRQPWRAASVLKSHQRVIPARVRVAGDVSARKSPIASGEAREATREADGSAQVRERIRLDADGDGGAARDETRRGERTHDERRVVLEECGRRHKEAVWAARVDVEEHAHMYAHESLVCTIEESAHRRRAAEDFVGRVVARGCHVNVSTSLTAVLRIEPTDVRPLGGGGVESIPRDA